MLKYKAAEYVRLSYTDDRQNESNSITNQKKIIEDFIKKHPDIEIISEKVDDGYSGILFDRPAFQEMMHDIEAGKINCVIVKDLSRLGREYIETGRYLRRIFPAYGVRFIAINDNIDTLKDASDDLSISVKSIVNDAYCHDISIKTRSALASKRQNGDYVGACTIYGYVKSKENRNQLAVDDYASKIVQDIFHMKIDGYSAERIGEELNRLGVLSPIEYKRYKGLPHPTGGYADHNGAKWSATTILRILKDETYTGMLIQGKQGTHNYKVRELINKPASEWVRIENAHPAIISKQDFALVQKILHLDTRTSPKEDKVYLFSGILICGCCGGRMTRKTVPYKDKKYYYYYCPTGKKKGCETPYMIKEEELIEIVLTSIKSHIDNIVSLEELLNTMSQERINKELLDQYAYQIVENQKQLDELLGFKTRLYESYINNILTKEEYRSMKAGYELDCEHLQGSIVELNQKMDEVRNNTSERTKWMEHFKRFSSLTTIDRRAVIQLVQSIQIFGKEELQINFRYKMEYEKMMAMVSGKEVI